MRSLLLAQSKLLQQASFTKNPFRMSSIGELRTLARCPQLAIAEADDEPEIRAKYRPFLLDPEIEKTDWISELELNTTISMAEADLQKTGKRLRILVLYGSIRTR
jgi:arsenic resistance protein ArsH